MCKKPRKRGKNGRLHGEKSSKENNVNKAIKWIITIILAVVVIIGCVFFVQTYSNNLKKVDYSTFVEYVVDSNGTIDDSKQIKKVRISNYTIYGYISENAAGNDYTYWANIPNAYNNAAISEMISVWMRDYNVKVSYDNPSSGSGWFDFVYIGIMVISLIAIIYMVRNMGGGSGKIANFGKSKAKMSTNIKVRFTDVAGADEEKEELKEVVEFLKNPKAFSDLGAKIPKGVLLVGPPGTGKTLFARAVAGEADVPFFSVSGSDFVEMYVGVGASRVRDLFDLAKKNQPCIIFIDEIDAVGRQRGAGLGGGNDEREQTLNQILVQMDGFDTNEGIIVIAATNRADILDSALLRPGRFDRQIHVSLPDVKGREQILKVHARNKPMAQNVNFRTVARITAGFSGAELANLLNEAAILAARYGKKDIGNAELYEAFNKVTMGPAKKSRVVTEEDKRATAYHEAGHAILAKLCKNCDNVHEVTIIPRGSAGGYTMTLPEGDRAYYRYSFLNDQLCMTLGGYVAEELVLEEVSSGPSSDLQHATGIVRKMVTEWGMSDKLGPLAYGSDGPVFIGRDYEERKVYSEETAATIDQEERKIIDAAYQRAKKLLTENRSVLDNMARVLVERETIFTEEVDMLMKGADYQAVIDYMDAQDAKSGNNSHNPFGAE